MKKNSKKNVGRGTPPKSHPWLTPWAPGQSGNPKGKPKGLKSTKTLIREFLEMTDFESLFEADDALAIKRIQENLKTKLTVKQMMVLSQAKKAIAHLDTSAFNALLDRVDGKPLTINKELEEGESYEEFLKKLNDEES